MHGEKPVLRGVRCFGGLVAACVLMAACAMVPERAWGEVVTYAAPDGEAAADDHVQYAERKERELRSFGHLRQSVEASA